jgi:hypothetical protein
VGRRRSESVRTTRREARFAATAFRAWPRANSKRTTSGSALRVHDLTHGLGSASVSRFPADADTPVLHSADRLLSRREVPRTDADAHGNHLPSGHPRIYWVHADS